MLKFPIKFNLLGLLFTLLIFSTSCNKENFIEVNESTDENISEEELRSLGDLEEYKDLKEFPEELTIDNWRKFLYAPKEVLEKIEAKEKKRIAIHPNTPEKSTKEGEPEVGELKGYVKGYDSGDFIIAKDVTVFFESSECSSTISTLDEPFNYQLPLYNCVNNLCMYNEEWEEKVTNGVTTYDLVLLGQHILGEVPFTETAQYVAGDINRSGSLTSLDMIALRRIILFIDSEFANSASVVYVPFLDYKASQAALDATGNPQYSILLQKTNNLDNCLAPNSITKDRVAIKTGDINGSWLFNN